MSTRNIFSWMMSDLLGYASPYPPFPLDVDGKNYVIATDGAIMVAVETAMDDVVPSGHAPTQHVPAMVALLRQMLPPRITMRFDAWKTFLGLPFPRTIACGSCKTSGTVSCFSCDGARENTRTCEHCNDSHMCACGTCGGLGHTPCIDCDGRGSHEPHRVRRGWILGGLYDLVRLLDISPHLKTADDALVRIARDVPAHSKFGPIFVDGPGWRIVLHGFRVADGDASESHWERLEGPLETDGRQQYAQDAAGQQVIVKAT